MKNIRFLLVFCLLILPLCFATSHGGDHKNAPCIDYQYNPKNRLKIVQLRKEISYRELPTSLPAEPNDPRIKRRLSKKENLRLFFAKFGSTLQTREEFRTAVCEATSIFMRGYLSRYSTKTAIDLFLGITPDEAAEVLEDTDLTHYYNMFEGRTVFYETVFANPSFYFSDDPGAVKISQAAYWLSHDCGFVPRDEIAEHVHAAQQIKSFIEPGDRLVFAGNSPVLIGRILEKICADDIAFIYLPLSGAPNRDRRWNRSLRAEDILTPNRYHYFKEHVLKKRGLTIDKLLTGTTWFVDVVISGAALSFCLEEILKDAYDDHQKKLTCPTPDFRIINLSYLSKRVGLESMQRYTDTYAQYGKLHLPSAGKFPDGSPTKELHIIVPMVQMTLKKCSETLNLDVPHDHERLVMPYNAIYWDPSFESCRDTWVNDLYLQVFLAYFDTNVDHFLKTAS